MEGGGVGVFYDGHAFECAGVVWFVFGFGKATIAASVDSTATVAATVTAVTIATTLPSSGLYFLFKTISIHDRSF